MGGPAAKPLDGKIALVTGASRGIGRAAALRLGAEGALVAVHFNRDRAAAQAVVAAIAAAGGTAFAIAADFIEASAAEQLFVAFDASLRQRGDKPELDILVNNAGIGSRQPIEKVTPDDFERMVAINLRAPFFVMQQALPRLVDGGRIINISSTAARISYAETPLYGATKAALQSLTLSTAKRLGPRRITVNAVAPGATRTDLNPPRPRSGIGQADRLRNDPRPGRRARGHCKRRRLPRFKPSTLDHRPGDRGQRRVTSLARWRALGESGREAKAGR